MNSNSAAAEAAVLAGCTCYFGYPITPQNELGEYMARRLTEVPGGVFIQSESERAIHVNIEIMRTFVRLKKLLASHAELAKKLDSLEKKYDHQFKIVFDAIRQMLNPPKPIVPLKPKGPIGFQP